MIVCLIVAELGSVFGKEKNASYSALHKRHKLSALHETAKREEVNFP